MSWLKLFNRNKLPTAKSLSAVKDNQKLIMRRVDQIITVAAKAIIAQHDKGINTLTIEIVPKKQTFCCYSYRSGAAVWSDLDVQRKSEFNTILNLLIVEFTDKGYNVTADWAWNEDDTIEFDEQHIIISWDLVTDE